MKIACGGNIVQPASTGAAATGMAEPGIKPARPARQARRLSSGRTGAQNEDAEKGRAGRGREIMGFDVVSARRRKTLAAVSIPDLSPT
ncbi:hypothetical protein CQA4T8M7_33250 [Sphaerotilus natans]|nr:hypothetical protein CQA4T8M7_33250 [Sphaerotilus natans]